MTVYSRTDSSRSKVTIIMPFEKICNLSQMGKACLCGPKTKTPAFARSEHNLRTIAYSRSKFKLRSVAASSRGRLLKN